MVKIPPSKAGDADSTPGQETKILHAAGKLSLCTTTKEALVPELESGPCSPQLEKTSVQPWRASAAKINKIKVYAENY